MNGIFMTSTRSTLSPGGEKSCVFDVRACGARGDGDANDTAAVQRAIDACHAAGGGRVFLGAGIFTCGTLYLRSRVEFFLDAGATLRGSPRRADYSTDGNAPYDVKPLRRTTSAAHLICAYNAENISIRGQGVIDGNGQAFFGPPREGTLLRRFSIPEWRPGHTLAFCECRDVLVEGVQLLNSPTYTIWPFACERVRIQGVTIRNPPETPNGDGIDPTACRDVLISQCLIESADDCIAIYSGPGNGMFGSDSRPCENVIVTGCILRSACNAVRIGPHGDGPIRDCILSDLVMDARVGLSLHVYAAMPQGLKDTIYDNVNGPLIENIQARNLIIRARESPFYCQVLPDSRPPAGIRDVYCSGLQIYGPGAVSLTGSADLPMERIGLADVVMHADTPPEPLLAAVPDPIGCLSSEVCRRIPHAFYLRHVRDARLRGVRVHWPAGGSAGRTAFMAEKSLDISAEGIENGYLTKPQSHKGGSHV